MSETRHGFVCAKYTVVMKVKHFTPVMNRLEVPILPKHIWEHISEKQLGSFKNLNPVGTGAFRVSSYQSNQTITLKANPHYWGGKPGIKTLVFQRFDNPTAMKLALANGTIDFAENLTPALWRSLEGSPGVKLVNAPSGNFDELAFNNGAATVSGKPIGNGNPALKDVNVRHAISYALNVPVLVKKVLLNTGEVGTSIIPPIYTQFHYTPPSSATYHFDPQKAEQILNADGWKMGPNGIRVKNGKQLSLRLVRAEPVADPDPGRPVHQGVAERDRHQDHHHRDVGQPAHGGHRQRPVRHVHVGLGRGAQPGLPAVGVHLRPALVRLRAELLAWLVGQLLLQPRLRQALPRAAVTRRRRQGQGRAADAEDAVRRRSLQRALLPERHAGLPQRQVHGVRPVAGQAQTACTSTRRSPGGATTASARRTAARRSPRTTSAASTRSARSAPQSLAASTPA